MHAIDQHEVLRDAAATVGCQHGAGRHAPLQRNLRQVLRGSKSDRECRREGVLTRGLTLGTAAAIRKFVMLEAEELVLVKVIETRGLCIW